MSQRVVFDCNTFLQAISAPNGPAGRCVQLAFERKVRLFISHEVVAELRRITNRPRVISKLKLQPSRISSFFESIELVATLLDGFPTPFEYDRDPDDAHYVNLALACGGKLIVSRDKDLLDLLNSSDPQARKLMTEHPDFRVFTPPQFLETVELFPTS